jgi:hypothetical protein
MKSKKSDQLTKQFNDAALKSKWNNEYKVRYDSCGCRVRQIKSNKSKTEFIQLNNDPDELDKQSGARKRKQKTPTTFLSR